MVDLCATIKCLSSAVDRRSYIPFRFGGRIIEGGGDCAEDYGFIGGDAAAKAHDCRIPAYFLTRESGVSRVDRT